MKIILLGNLQYRPDLKNKIRQGRTGARWNRNKRNFVTGEKNNLKRQCPMLGEGGVGWWNRTKKPHDPWESRISVFSMLDVLSVSAILVFLLMPALPRYCVVMMDQSQSHTLCVWLY